MTKNSFETQGHNVDELKLRKHWVKPNVELINRGSINSGSYNINEEGLIGSIYKNHAFYGPYNFS